jgi:hypothetical protein
MIESAGKKLRMLRFVSQASVPLALVQALPAGLAAQAAIDPLRYAAHRDAGALGALSEAAALKRRYFATLAENVTRLSRTAEILDVAEAAGVTLLPYKGVLLADAVYPDPGARTMADIDLLVRADDLATAEAALARLGFRRSFPGGGRRYRLPFAHDVALYDGQQVLELHVRWVHDMGARSEVEPVFARAIELPVLGRMRRVPSWADHLMMVAVHAASHCFAQSTWLVDVALLAERAGGFAEAAERARAARAERAFATAVALATGALGRLVPPAVLPAGGRGRARWLAPLLASSLGREPSRVASLAARLLMVDRAVDAAAMVASRAAVVLDERLREGGRG